MVNNDAKGCYLRVKPGTRNHRGLFIREMAYQLMGVEQTGWALICDDNNSCHYVDPDSLKGNKRCQMRSLAKV